MGSDHDAEPVTDEMHDNSWSVNLETPEYADDPERAINDGIDAIEHTAPGNHLIQRGSPAVHGVDETLRVSFAHQNARPFARSAKPPVSLDSQKHGEKQPSRSAVGLA